MRQDVGLQVDESQPANLSAMKTDIWELTRSEGRKCVM